MVALLSLSSLFILGNNQLLLLSRPFNVYSLCSSLLAGQNLLGRPTAAYVLGCESATTTRRIERANGDKRESEDGLGPTYAEGEWAGLGSSEKKRKKKIGGRGRALGEKRRGPS